MRDNNIVNDEIGMEGVGVVALEIVKAQPLNPMERLEVRVMGREGNGVSGCEAIVGSLSPLASQLS